MDSHNDKIYAQLAGAVDAYRSLQDKPWYKRWYLLILAFVVAALAVAAASKGISDLARRRMAIRQKKARNARLAAESAKIKNRERRVRVQKRSAEYQKKLDVAEEALRERQQMYDRGIQEVRNAKNWKELSSAMADSSPASTD